MRKKSENETYLLVQEQKTHNVWAFGYEVLTTPYYPFFKKIGWKTLRSFLMGVDFSIHKKEVIKFVQIFWDILNTVGTQSKMSQCSRVL